MITEIYINNCFTAVLNKNTKIRRDKTLYRDILDSLRSYKKQEEIPINIQNKFNCLIKVCEMSLEDKTIENILDSISFSEKYKNLVDFLQLKKEEEIHDTTLLDNIKQIRLRKKVTGLFSNHNRLGDFLNTIKEGSFDSLDDLVLDYEKIIRELYTNMMDSNRAISIQATSSLDLVKDDFEHVVNTIIKKYEKSNTTSSGFTLLDTEILNGGFEPSRLYIFGGSSGAGKSTLMSNMITYASTTHRHIIDDKKQSKNMNVYIYVTLENTIEEALLRTYQSLFEKTTTQAIRDIVDGINIKDEIIKELAKTNSTVIMKYFPATTISTLDLAMVVDDAINEYGKDSIRGLYVDYLDLLGTDVKYELYRLELGHITVSLKSLAVEYNIPVIALTQLGRSTYRIQNSQDLNLDQMGESIKKVEHADFVALLSKDPVDDKLVHFKVGKNRSGKAGTALDFNVDFTIYKFKNAVKISNKRKQDATTNDSMGFGGIQDI